MAGRCAQVDDRATADGAPGRDIAQNEAVAHRRRDRRVQHQLRKPGLAGGQRPGQGHDPGADLGRADMQAGGEPCAQGFRLIGQHQQADIHALGSNVNGYAEGAWIPYLLVKYEVTKQGSGEVIRGDMMPMVASDGPHYGDNVKLAGPGKYHVKLTVYPPNAKENAMGMHYGRHTDRATGVRPWFKPVVLEWDFTYAGIGKKGGY